ncbi:MAG: winged helix-turn-helix domain-containing protein [Bacteroidaceae bacterium]|jgi:hypothetical protein
MSKREVDSNAKRIWQLLGDNCTRSYKYLKEKTGLDDFEMGMAIGWLMASDMVVQEKSRGDDVMLSGCVNVYIG